MATVGQATAQKVGHHKSQWAKPDDPVTLEPRGGDRFRFVAPTGGGVVGEVVRFVEKSGRPMRMYAGDSWIDRVRAQ